MLKREPGQILPIGDLSVSFLPRISRRSFAHRAVAIAATSLSSASGLGNANADTPEQQLQSGVDEAAKLGLTTVQVQSTDAKVANVIREYGDRLSAEQRRRLRRILLYNEKMLGSVRAFDLENGDPPAGVLRLSQSASK